MREAVLRQQLAYTQSQLGKSEAILRETLKEKEKSEKKYFFIFLLSLFLQSPHFAFSLSPNMLSDHPYFL